MTADWRYAVALLLVVLGTVGVLMYDAHTGDSKLISTANALAQANVSARQATSGGRSVGEVVVNNNVVIRIRTSAGGLTAYQRAQKIASRLNSLMGPNIGPNDITTGIVNGQDVVLAGSEVLVTADSTQARLNGTSTTMLAEQWANNLRVAFGGQPIAYTTTGAAGAPSAQKIVPILSVGTGVRIGGAQVTGPSNYVDQVKAVAQIQGDFGSSVRARVLVPVSTENVVQNISRVPQTSVTALVDIRL